MLVSVSSQSTHLTFWSFSKAFWISSVISATLTAVILLHLRTCSLHTQQQFTMITNLQNYTIFLTRAVGQITGITLKIRYLSKRDWIHDEVIQQVNITTSSCTWRHSLNLFTASNSQITGKNKPVWPSNGPFLYLFFSIDAQ